MKPELVRAGGGGVAGPGTSGIRLQQDAWFYLFNYFKPCIFLQPWVAAGRAEGCARVGAVAGTPWGCSESLFLVCRARMSLFGSTSGFGTGGTSMFGSTTADNHNPMKVRALPSVGASRLLLCSN